MSSGQRIFLVINKYAGFGKGVSVIKSVVPFLQQHGCEVTYCLTEYPGHATVLARDASKANFDLIVAVGGDGTVNEVAQGIIGTATKMGIVPMGSGNGLARELGISMHISKSRQTLLHGHDQSMDVCLLAQQPFLCTSGIGFDALVAHRMANVKSRGFFSYVKITLAESFRFRPIDVVLTIDGIQMQCPVFLITFANASQFGNNAYIAPNASISDGLIDVVVVKPFAKIWLPIFSAALFLGLAHKLPFVGYYKAKEIEIEKADTPYAHFDGEPEKLSSFPVHIRLHDQKLNVRCGKQN